MPAATAPQHLFTTMLARVRGVRLRAWPAVAGVGADQHRIHLLMARIRATAARLWLSTMQALAAF